MEKQNIKYQSGIAIGSRPKWHTSNIMGTNQEPWMTRGSINFLYDFINNIENKDKKDLLEYGCGSSTAYFLSLNLKVSSIEHHSKWLSLVKKELPENLLKNWKPYLLPCNSVGDDIGSDGEYYDDYVNYVDQLETFDIIIVDGRCRSKCIGKSINKLNSGGLFIVDNAERKSYHKSINDNIPKNWTKLEFPTPVDTTIIWLKP